ncbi:MAG: hypothetical protein OMM_00877 [Candidatus Magnetoglobus multicellularis str. Araruama]|uniref:Uncharacterized protein n=1 Tax=Candidatus Magnetoglobus multicellularis str. Araruama TaxID=890399 RepID=A0A1V1PFK9_9BACT|nr:MAG: hypothetical protein OMM_00877 [Candidatus Magnetoglobus multicellularis str. Araruama]
MKIIPTIIIIALLINPSAMADFPPSDLLKTLETRLLEKPDCLPACADISQMIISIVPDRFKITLSVHAASDTAIPLPALQGEWLPDQITIDLKPATGIRKDQQKHIWVYVKKGKHQIVLRGAPPERNHFHIPIQIKPRQIKTRATGWLIQGVSDDGQISDNVQFNRIEKSLVKLDKPLSIPAFFHVTRILYISVQWHVVTTVKRITPSENPVSVSIPLLPGESMMTGQIQVKDNKALISMKTNQTQVEWQSVLEFRQRIHLEAPKTNQWVETWILDADTKQHVSFEGIPVIHHQDRQGKHRPTWRPWPTESVDINLTRLSAINGKNLTIDQVRMDMYPGARFHQINLSMKTRVSMGQTHTLKLPIHAMVQSIRIDNTSLPVSTQNNAIGLPLDPGRHDIEIKWHQLDTTFCFLKLPEVHIGMEAVNATVNLHLPGNTWILWTNGPGMGPVVLFWSYLILLAIVSFGLAHLGWTPLKGWQWFLLGLGLTQIHVLEALVVVGWFLIFYYRKQHPMTQYRWLFNFRQLGLILWTGVALYLIYMAIQSGLLGIPQMQIKGNGSTWKFLSWYVDRTNDTLPQPWVVFLPLYVFRIAMLIWALWLAQSLIQWIRWMWTCFSDNDISKWGRTKK